MIPTLVSEFFISFVVVPVRNGGPWETGDRADSGADIGEPRGGHSGGQGDLGPRRGGAGGDAASSKIIAARRG